MTRIALVNMPFADWNRPSFALSQLAAFTKREADADVRVDVHYLNVDFAHYLGAASYDSIAGDLTHLMTGLGDWMFRRVAFPEQEDNVTEYFNRYYNGRQWAEFREDILRLRAGLPAFCRELIDRYELASADIVGFTSMFAQNGASLAMARLIKDQRPERLVVMGGANCEVPMGAVLAQEADAVDAVFSGPALHTFPEFVRCVSEGDLDKIHEIPGILTQRNCHEERFAKAIGRERDINDFAEPEYESFVEVFSANRDALNRDVKPVLMFETSRGCWWGQRSHCTFCGLNGLGMDYRSMDPDVAIRQFNWLFSYAPWCQDFACTDNILPKHYPKEVFAELDPPPDVSLFYEIKIPVSDRDMRELARVGVKEVQPGVESLATSTLKLMAKGTTSFLNVQFLKSCNVHGISPRWNLLIGFPGESAEVYEKYMNDIPLLTHLPPPTGAFMVRFDRFSPYFARASEYGLDLRPMDFYRLIYPFSDDQLARMAYFFADKNVAPYMLNAIKWVGPLNEQIGRWLSRWEDGGRRPELALYTTGEARVVDTRDVERREIPVDEELIRVLRLLSSPVTVERAARDLKISPERATEHFAFLRAHHLIFEEGERVMSLVQLDETDAAAPPGRDLDITPV